eukprot:4272526-Pyramimonas_sp.AAC.1
MATQTALTYVAHLGAGKPAKAFGYIPDCKGNLNLSDDSSIRAYILHYSISCEIISELNV